jgi:hypothetical protein
MSFISDKISRWFENEEEVEESNYEGEVKFQPEFAYGMVKDFTPEEMIEELSTGEPLENLSDKEFRYFLDKLWQAKMEFLGMESVPVLTYLKDNPSPENIRFFSEMVCREEMVTRDNIQNFYL